MSANIKKDLPFVNRQYVYYNPWRDKLYILDEYGHKMHPCTTMPEILWNDNKDCAVLMAVDCVYLGVL